MSLLVSATYQFVFLYNFAKFQGLWYLNVSLHWSVCQLTGCQEGAEPEPPKWGRKSRFKCTKKTVNKIQNNNHSVLQCKHYFCAVQNIYFSSIHISGICVYSSFTEKYPSPLCSSRFGCVNKLLVSRARDKIWCCASGENWVHRSFLLRPSSSCKCWDTRLMTQSFRQKNRNKGQSKSYSSEWAWGGRKKENKDRLLKRCTDALKQVFFSSDWRKRLHISIENGMKT